MIVLLFESRIEISKRFFNTLLPRSWAVHTRSDHRKKGMVWARRRPYIRSSIPFPTSTWRNTAAPKKGKSSEKEREKVWKKYDWCEENALFVKTELFFVNSELLFVHLFWYLSYRDENKIISFSACRFPFRLASLISGSLQHAAELAGRQPAPCSPYTDGLTNPFNI